MASHSKTNSTTYTTYVVGMDPSNEIDDELFANWALENLKNAKVYFMCVPGNALMEANIIQAEHVAWERMAHMISLFPDKFEPDPMNGISTYTTDSSIFTLCTPSWLGEISSKVHNLRGGRTGILNVDYYIDIAPNMHIPPHYFQCLKIKTRIVMGTLSAPHTSINLTKSMLPPDTEVGAKQRAEYEEQERIFAEVTDSVIDIPTMFARQVPIPYSHMEKLPEELRRRLDQKAFEQFVARPNASFVWACDISNANLATIVNMFTCKDLNDLEKNVSSPDVASLGEKIDTFIADAPAMSQMALDEYKFRLMRIAKMVMFVTKTHYKDSNFNVDSLHDLKTARKNWDEWRKQRRCDGTPAYDLIAAAVLVDPNALLSIESCKNIINNL